MSRRQAVACSLAFFSLSFVVQPDADAQQMQRYRPAMPTISPYLNLTRQNFGGLPNYFSLVRPQLQQQSINRFQQTVLANQAVQIGSLENDLQRAQEGLTKTGKSSNFMTDRVMFQNTAPYYRQPQAIRRR